MAWNTSTIIRDSTGVNPVPQYFNNVTNQYEPVFGQSNAPFNIGQGFNALVGEYTLTFQAGVQNPSAALALTATGSASSFAAGTVYVENDFYNQYGRTTTGTSQSSVTVTAGQQVTTSITLPATAQGVGIYVGTASGPLLLANVSSTGVISYSGSATSGLAVTVSGSVLSFTISASANGGALASASNYTGVPANSNVSTLVSLPTTPQKDSLYCVSVSNPSGLATAVSVVLNNGILFGGANAQYSAVTNFIVQSGQVVSELVQGWLLGGSQSQIVATLQQTASVSGGSLSFDVRAV